MSKAKGSPAKTMETSMNEKILQECHELYVNKEFGLIKIGALLGLNLLAPRRKIVVMLIGNHSAGKSSFINWYINDRVQKTGVAIETQGFTFVTSGKRRETLTGKATLHLYPHFKDLQRIKSLVGYISTEISPSRERRFNMVTFIDTPGLVDGEMFYPYDIKSAILWLANLSDQIYVFFDPIGQALCKRTLNLVEKINATNGEKMRFYLSKADEAGTESDRQKVMMQVVQELCKRPGLNKAGFEMPTVFIPNSISRETKCVNQIECICEQIEKTINYTIQNTLNTLEKDCTRIVHLIREKIHDDNIKRSLNLNSSLRGFSLALVGLFIPNLILLNCLSTDYGQTFVSSVLGPNSTKTVLSYLYPIETFWANFDESYHSYITLLILFLSLFLILLGKYCSAKQSTLNKKDRKAMLEKKQYIEQKLIEKKHSLYTDYLSQSVGDTDMNL